MKKRIVWIILVALTVLVIGCKPANKESKIAGFEKEPTITLYLHETGETKELPIEEYIMGVVAGEMRPDWPMSAYAAQAILARTFTMEKLSRGGTRAIHGTDMCDAVEHTQAYNPAEITPAIREAVRATRGEVAAWRGNYIKAWFHAYSGGHTESAKIGLNFKEKEPPYIKMVKSPGEKYAPMEIKSWVAEFTLDEMQKALGDMGFQVRNINKIEISKKSKTGRAWILRIFHGGGKLDVTASDLRLALGADRLASAWLTAEPVIEGDRVIFKGTGYGHGVGMDQWGAYAMAKEGKESEEIIKYFFKGISIEKIWE
jgi:stage II sporulation protein D